MDKVSQRLDTIFNLYQHYGHNDYIGEPVSQIEHMSQTAEMAIKEDFDDEVILAAFFHDIGHICVAKRAENTMAEFGIKNHESIGAAFLKSMGFSAKITDLIESHVPAKRYLTFTDPDYYENLSEASKKTLEFQGGTMTKEEAFQFEAAPFLKERIRLRQWDELAKEKNIPILDLEIIRDKAKKHLEGLFDDTKA